MRDRLVKSVSAIADSQGQIRFQLEPSEQGYVREGTLQVPNAPSGAQFTAAVLGTPWGQWAGPTNFGPIQAWGGEFVVVTGTGLVPATAYTVTFIGVFMPQNEAEPKPPVAPLSTVSVETSTPVISALKQTGPFSVDFRPPPLTRRVTVVSSLGVIVSTTNVAIIGKTTNCTYMVKTYDSLFGGNTVQGWGAIEPSLDPIMTFDVQCGISQVNTFWVLCSTVNPLADPDRDGVVAVIGSTTPGITPVRTAGAIGVYRTSVIKAGVINTNNQSVITGQSGLCIYVQTISIRSNGLTGAQVHTTSGVSLCFFNKPGIDCTQFVYPNGGFECPAGDGLQVDVGPATIDMVVTYLVGFATA